MEIWNPAAKSSGTAYLVADRLALTAYHNVQGAEGLQVRALDREGRTNWASAEVLWPESAPDLDHEPQADAALIRITSASWVPPGGEWVRWGRIGAEEPPPTASTGRLSFLAIGFPKSEKRGMIRDTKEIRGHIETLTGLKSLGLITAYVDQVAVPDKAGASRWSGASGSALFVGGRLIGVVIKDRRQDYSADQLTAVSVASLTARPGFALALKAAGVELLLEDVTASDPEGPPTAYDIDVPRGLNNLPELPSPHFVGRAEEMAELKESLSGGSQTITQVLHGLGGVGKTTLALHYAHGHVDAYRLVWWIRSDAPELIEAGFASLTHRLRGGESAGLTTEQAVEWAVGWLQTHPGWLLVFDNAERPEHVHRWSGQLRSAGRHLVTSRYRRGWICTPIALRMLDEDASLTLLSRLAGGDDEADEARALAADLGHLPLALEQAGAFIGQTGITTAEYRSMWNQYPSHVTDVAPGGSNPERTVARIWRITLAALERQDPRAESLLRIAAWYAPTGIPRRLFAGLSRDPIDLAQLVGLLADYNMITLEPEGFGLHRLVQMVARTPNTDDPHSEAERISTARRHAAALLGNERPEGSLLNVESWPACRALLPHVEALVGAGESAEDPAYIADLLDWAGRFLSEQGSLRQSMHFLERHLALTARVYGEDHPRTTYARNNLGTAFARDPERAIPMYERALEGAVRVLGEDHPYTLISRQNLASAYASAGDAVRAIPLLEQALMDAVRVWGEDHRNTLVARGMLAMAYDEAGDMTQAIPLLEQSLRDQVRVLGADHPYTLVTQTNLASAYDKSGDRIRAIPMMKQALADCVRVLGACHHGTLAARSNLADAYERAGDLTRAIPMHEATLEGRRRVLREDHQETSLARHSLAVAYTKTGNPKRAIPLFETSVDRFTRLLGEDHRYTLTALAGLAFARRLAGDPAQAIALFEQALAGCLRTVGEDPKMTGVIRRNLEELRAQET
ncbi:FxSxx-COOH system tetratricopeptide repeat protein [Streptomyces diastaticus]|uniref:FxSxx-COOH system tetratricopeptide repeat protein n=1 Tax=Streptomyces diastaticus TaxID=1956 RepID=UPI0035D96652